MFFRGREPNRAIQYLFYAAICPLSFWYVVHQNLGLLRQVWENAWGKLAYGLAASITVTGCKVLADQQIRLLTQSNPSLFPSAQQAITVLNIIGMTLTEIAAFLWLCAMARISKELFAGYGEMFWRMLDIFSIREMLGLPIRPRKFGSSVSLLANFFAYIWAGFFIFLIVLFLDSGFSGFVTGVRPFNLTEEFLIWSSFIPNDVGLQTGSRRSLARISNRALSYLRSAQETQCQSGIATGTSNQRRPRQVITHLCLPRR